MKITHGAMQLTRMFLVPASRAAERVRPMTACWFLHSQHMTNVTCTCRPAKISKTNLAGRIRRPTGNPTQASHARRTHDAGVTIHPLQFRPDAIKNALDIHIHDEIPVFIRGVDNLLAHRDDAGEIRGAGQGAQVCDGFVEPVAYFPAVFYIHGLCVDFDVWVLFFDVGYGCVEGFALDVCEGDGGAAGGEEVGGREGDAGGGAGDGDDFTFERSHVRKALGCKHCAR